MDEWGGGFKRQTQIQILSLLNYKILIKLFNLPKPQFLSLSQDNLIYSSLKSREFLPHGVV